MKKFTFIVISTLIVSINAQVLFSSNTAYANEIESLNTAFKLGHKETLISTSSTVNCIEVAHTNPPPNLDLVRTALGSDIGAFHSQDNKTQQSKVRSTDRKLKLVSYDFGTVANFIIFSGAGAVANTGVSTFTGDVGSHAGAIAGFGTPTVLNGTVENANPITLQASIDLTALCLQLQNTPTTVPNHIVNYGNGETLLPGVYSAGAAATLTGALTLDGQGDSNAVFIFKIGGAFAAAAGSSIILTNGASSDNVYWIAIGAVALGAGSTMFGTFIGYPGAVSAVGGVALEGRLYATAGAIAVSNMAAAIPVVTPVYNYLGSHTTNGTPLYLEDPSDVVSVETLETISNALPESYPVPDYNPQYITSGYDTDLKIETNTDVWVTFISEGTGYRNVLGFYTYDLNTPPTTTPTKDDIYIIFPNVSALGSGGGLQVGDKVNIGNFAANTGIGWVLLANAWSSSEQTVGTGFWEFYSNPNFNPEGDATLRTHNILLSDPINERIVLGFEDVRRDNASSDQEFNSAIFYVTVNQYDAINTNNFSDIAEASDVTSAYDGGLESNGNLANLIAKRNFKREKDRDSKNKKEKQSKFNKTELQLKSTANSLIDYLPETGMYQTEIANISSPTDLLEVTNAKEIFSVDYYQGEKRISAVLATATEGAIYDHSKIICDRLNNSSLEDIRTVETRGHQIISSKIKRATGEIEYTLSFSIKLGATENELFSFWNIDQYPSGNYQNFQIWGSAFSQVFAIANFIIDKHTNDKGLKSTKVAEVLPNVFVKSGSYANGVIELFLVNKTQETSIIFDGNIAETEVSEYNNVTNTLSLTGNYNEVLYIETGVLFDIGFSLQTSTTSQKDALYLADGPWGVDYLKDYATVTKFEVTTSEMEFRDAVYEVDRNVSISGEVKGNVNLFRHLLPGDQTLNMTAYSFINFLITNNEPVELIIMQEEDRDWENRIRYVIPKNNAAQSFSIPFTDFTDSTGNPVQITNIKTVVFSIIGDYMNNISFEMSVHKLSFSGQDILSVQEANINKNRRLINYPNPFKDNTIIRLSAASSHVFIQVFDVLGRTVDFQKISTDTDSKSIHYSIPNCTPGIYKYRLKDASNQIAVGTFLVH